MPCIDGSQPQDTQAFIRENPLNVPEWMELDMHAAWYVGFSARQSPPSPAPETETDQDSGGSACQMTPSSGLSWGPETDMDLDFGEPAGQMTPSPGPDTETDQISGESGPQTTPSPAVETETDQDFGDLALFLQSNPHWRLDF